MTFDARRTGWTVEKCVEECIERFDDDPYRQVYYTTYSDVFHTDPDCPYLEGSESLHYAGHKYNFNAPNCTGASRVPSDLQKCSWCASRYDLKFDNQHVPAILGGEKWRTARIGTRVSKFSTDGTVVLRDETAHKVGTAPIEAVRETTARAFVRDDPPGHTSYASVAEFVAVMNRYYPDEGVTADTTVVDVAWGDVTPATEQRSVVDVAPLARRRVRA